MSLLFPETMIPVQPLARWPFGSLQPFAYDFIMIDPPWTFATRSKKGITKKGAGGQYRLMTLNDIRALPVKHLAKPDCVLWLWATAPLLPQAISIMESWGFRYVTCGSWAKRTRKGKLRWGTGYRFRSTSEPILIGIRGKPKTARNIPSHIDGLAREHSRKPEEAYAYAERMMIGARRADVFARQARPGWEAFGDQVDRFLEGAS